MSVSSQTAQKATSAKGFVLTDAGEVRSGIERVYPLNKLKASPDNVRKGGHKAEVIEARAASILAKGVIQPPVVKPERRADGSETGYAFVTAGEGRRLALRLLAKRKLIPKTALVKCSVDEANDAAEVSLAENIAREPLHPADEFLAFHDLAERQGHGVETIAARFGVSATLVRQRLRLAAVAPELIARYRAEELTLDQLMAYAVSEDHARQLQVFEAYPQGHPSTIRRAMTEKTVPANDRRAAFIGIDAYIAAGGTVIRDLFTDDGGGYLSDAGLIDQLVVAKLTDLADDLKAAEGWKWAEWSFDFPHGHGLSRVWAKPVPVTAEQQARRDAYDALCEEWGQVEDLPPEIEAQLSALEADLPEVTEAFDPEDIARAGVWVMMGYDGHARIERGFVRPEDVRIVQEPDDDEDEGGADDKTGPGVALATPEPDDEPEGDPRAPLSAKLIADLTAHRTAGLRLALANDPDLALVALTHVLALWTFKGAVGGSCLSIIPTSDYLPTHAEGVKVNPAFEAMRDRYDQWAKQMPDETAGLWDFVVGLDTDSRASLLAFCVGRTLDAVKSFNGRGGALAHAERLATATDLDMTAFWQADAAHYLTRGTKAHVLSAVSEAVSPDTAQRLSGLKKGDLIAAAEPDLVKARWLPALLRTRPSSVGALGDGGGGESDETGGQDEEAAPSLTEANKDLLAAE